MSVVVPIGWAFIGDFQAPPKGGSQVFISWLCKNIESAGSKIFLNHRVKKVLLNGKNKAIGVSLEKGNSINSLYVLAAGVKKKSNFVFPDSPPEDRLRFYLLVNSFL